MKALNFSIAALLILQTVCSAATLGISISSGSYSLRDQINSALSGGNLGVNGDGTRVNLGYFADSTQSTPFGVAGSDAFASFTALTGPTPATGSGPLTPFGINFTVGDQAANGTGNGELFVLNIAINTGVADSLLPTPGTPLILRFYNAAQTFVLDLANVGGLWNWRSPATPASSLDIDLDSAGLVSRAIGTNNRTASPVSSAAITPNLQTTNPVVPEPTSAMLMMLGLVSLTALRRRQAK